MYNRSQKLQELIEGFHALKKPMAFKWGSTKIPRITPSQWGALMIIEQRGKSTIKDVAKVLGISSSATTQLIDGLVDSKYVIRETYIKDRRTVTLTLSKKTKIHVDKIKKQVLKKFLKIFDILNDKEFDQYICLNKKITDSLKKN